jgi:hypothetical protein
MIFMIPRFASLFGLVWLVMTAGLSAAQDSVWEWQARAEVWDDAPHGPVPVAPASDPNQPGLVLGLPGTAFQERYAPEFESGQADQADSYAFDGTAYAHVPDLWSNPAAFEGVIRFRPEDSENSQTLLLVSGVFDLRLEPEAAGKVSVVFYVLSGGRPTSIRSEPIPCGEWVDVTFGLRTDHTIFLHVGEAAPLEEILPGDLDPWNTYPQLFVGSSNPDRFLRPFTGAISAIRINPSGPETK